MELREDISYTEQPIRNMDRKEHTLSTKRIVLVRVMWNHHLREQATLEREEEMPEYYPHIFKDYGMIVNLGAKFL